MTTDDSSQGSSSQGEVTSESSSSSAPAQNTNTTQSDSSAGAASASSGSVASSAVDANGNPVLASPAYQPNYKFRAFGKEHEIPENFRSFIKDKETEEAFRKIHEKSFAMEKFQADEKKIKGDFDSYRTDTEPNIRAFNHFNNLLKNKDWDNLFGGLKVPEEEIFNWVEKRLQLRQMPAEQRQEFERQAQVRQQNYAYENQLNEIQTQHKQLATQTRVMQLENVLARQDVSSQAEQIEKAYGEPGAFRNLVIEEAVNHYNRTGEDLPADQAVHMAVQKYGRFLQGANQGTVNSQGQQVSAQASQNATQSSPPIIPHIGGSSRSPVRKQPRSIEDLKNMAKNL